MDTTIEEEKYETNIIKYLCDAVKKRCLNTERPIACLLSGGLDSSLIAALVNHFYKMDFGLDKSIETYSIGLKGSEDLKYAKVVADYIGSNHTEIIVTEKEMFEVIPELIYAIESYDTTTVRASIGNWLLGKYISTHSDNKVIFNGDGSDELFGGYLYMNKCPDNIEFDKETRRLLRDIHLFDVLRSDKCISSHGLEPRTPFLDKSFVNYVLSIPSNIRNHNIKRRNNDIVVNYFNKHKIDKANKYNLVDLYNFEQISEKIGCEKHLLRSSVMSHNSQLLPSEILWRKKEAFSDGVSTVGRSLYQILQEMIAKELNSKTVEPYEPCIETEKLYYKKIFDGLYPNCSHVLPYYWMPKYINPLLVTDPSARTLT
jgi:asparagine synthase (glutamine-hydrolysing)